MNAKEKEEANPCTKTGIISGTATVGSYLSGVFKCTDKAAKLEEIKALFKAIGFKDSSGNAITADQLCRGPCPDRKTCMPTTLQSDTTDDGELDFNGPDANGNCYYYLVITGKGNVGFSAAPGTCECM